MFTQVRIPLLRAQRRYMSVRPSAEHTPTPPREKVTLRTLQILRTAGAPITMLTAYDYPTARACSSDPLIDITLVGDSLAQVCLGYASTTQLTLSDMIHHAAAVRRGTTHPLLVADMPFGTYHVSTEEAVSNAVRLVREAGVEAVKLEGGSEIVGIVRRLTQIGIPVMGHVGLLPQRHAAMSGYKVQGRSAAGAKAVLNDALALQKAGAFSVVVEAVPKELGQYITEALTIPTIGIGAGPWTSGQVLVWDDVIGTWSGHKAKFVRHFGDLRSARADAVHSYAEAVRAGTFPNPLSESYAFEKQEWEAFLKEVKVRVVGPI